ncbi:MAG: magnesium transporter [Actinomycetales bacterium]|nr:magnesium transporter [Actinomycetales bacterium]
MTSPGSFPGRRGAASIPHGEVVGSYPTYLEAQSVVDRLAKADFPVKEVSILGRDLTTVERITGKLSWNRAALEGALSGLWFGLFVGLLFFLIAPDAGFAYLGAALLVGAASGMFFRLGTYAIGRRSRDFQSTREVLAESYEVVVPSGLVARAKDVLAMPPAEG